MNSIADFEPPSQWAAFRLVILMVASHDQLMHQNSEWFFRQPRDIPIAGDESSDLVSGALVEGGRERLCIDHMDCRSVRGADTLTAVGLCAEIGDFERFARAEHG